MKNFQTRYVLVSLCMLLMSACDQNEEQASLPEISAISELPFPVSDEAIDLANYPVVPDPELGVSTARLGEGKVYQLEVTLIEIPPGGQAPPNRHLAEEYIYIVAGEGYTTMWSRAGEKPQRYQWSAGDLLSPTPNAWYQHYNSVSDKPARYLSLKTTPLTNNLFHDKQFVISSDFVFKDRWQMGITQQPVYKRPDNMDMMAGHYVPDLPGRSLQEVGGRWGMNLRPDEGDMAGNRLMETFVREYRSNDKGIPSHGDRHPWEKVYIGLEGEGLAVLKTADGPAKVVNWKKGELFFVEGNEHHDIWPRFDSAPTPPYPRIMQMKAPGYFDGIGNAGETEYTMVTKDDEIFVEIR